MRAYTRAVYMWGNVNKRKLFVIKVPQLNYIGHRPLPGIGLHHWKAIIDNMCSTSSTFARFWREASICSILCRVGGGGDKQLILHGMQWRQWIWTYLWSDDYDAIMCVHVYMNKNDGFSALIVWKKLIDICFLIKSSLLVLTTAYTKFRRMIWSTIWSCSHRSRSQMCTVTLSSRR